MDNSNANTGIAPALREDNSASLSFGEKAAGISFNPGGHPDVNATKRQFADIIDNINNMRERADSPEAKRYYSAAITQAEMAQMLAVKAITWQY